ncbi:hypothetical protein H0E87_028268 [Populus deltoides]|uniref:Uncharacterized protein n=1 Tax=Populus deltoides TaxID=3696 RepID=A0A8T2WVJ3_POPDE|nr:hypothetical protein H0E87_028268 [Populus deltoides]
MLRGRRAWFSVSAWSLHGLSLHLAGWKLLFGSFNPGNVSGVDDVRALHALACGFFCLVIQLLAGLIDFFPVFLGYSLAICLLSICMDEMLPPVAAGYPNVF